jgi:hypothetical protein
VVAAGAGPMQIQLSEGVVSRCAGTVAQSIAAGRGRGKSEVSAKFSRREGSREGKDAVCRTARHRETERAGTRKSVVL